MIRSAGNSSSRRARIRALFSGSRVCSIWKFPQHRVRGPVCSGSMTGTPERRKRARTACCPSGSFRVGQGSCQIKPGVVSPASRCALPGPQRSSRVMVPAQDGPDGDHLDPADPMKLAGTVGTGGVDPFYPAFFQPVFQLFSVCRIFFRKQEKRGLAAAAGCSGSLAPSGQGSPAFFSVWMDPGQKGTAGPENGRRFWNRHHGRKEGDGLMKGHPRNTRAIHGCFLLSLPGGRYRAA